MRKILFGTGGWRAIIADEFTKENIERVAQALSTYLIEENKAYLPVVIGYDRRFLSDKASLWAASVLAANNIKVKLMKRSSPTPLVMFIVKNEHLSCGLEITASHNSSEYNGIKIIVEEGRDAPIEVTEKLENIINAKQNIKRIPLVRAEELNLLEYIKNPFNPYIDDILSKLNLPYIKARGLRIAFDPMHGSGTYPLLVILNTARCTVDLINNNKDPYFSGAYPAPSEETLQDLQNKVKKEGYDLGIAFDGDGDRLGIIDPTGAYISSNDILSMLYWYLHEKKGWKGPVVRNVSTTHLLDKMAKDFNEECYEVPVGFKWISSEMDKRDAVLGGESSGGLTVKGHINGKDSIYAASLFIEMLSVTKMSPLEIKNMIEKKYGKTYFKEKVFTFPSNKKEKISSFLKEEKNLPKFDNVEKIGFLDGTKIYFKNGDFVNCRFSGTEPLLRIMSEGSSEKLAESYILEFSTLLNKIL